MISAARSAGPIGDSLGRYLSAPIAAVRRRRRAWPLQRRSGHVRCPILAAMASIEADPSVALTGKTRAACRSTPNRLQV